LETAGTQSVSLKDLMTATLSANEDAISVQASTAKILNVSGFPNAVTAGTANSLSVIAYDAFGNVADGYHGTVAFSSSDGRAGLPAAYTFGASDAGKRAFAVTLDTAGVQLITVKDVNANALSGIQSGITVNPAAAKSLKVTGFPTSVTAGTASTVTVGAYDAF